MLGALALTGALFAASGCAPGRTAREEWSAALARSKVERSRWPKRYAATPPPASLVGHRGARPATATASTKDNDAPSTLLASLIEEALDSNPEIAQARARAEALTEAVAAEQALPDPVLAVNAWPTPVRTAEGDSFATVSLRQRFVLPNRLSARGRQALAAARAALASWRQARQRIVRDVKRSYFDLYVLDRSIEVTVDNRRLLEGLLGVVRAQVIANRRSQDDLLRLQVELSVLDAELIDLRQRRAVVVSRLNALLDRAADTPVPNTQALALREAPMALALETLLKHAEQRRPALANARFELERTEEAIRLARLEYVPDPELGLGWMQMSARRSPSPGGLSEQGRDNVSVSLGVRLPVGFARLHARLEQARAEHRRARANLERTRDEVADQVRGALERVNAEHDLARLYRDSIVPQAREAYQVAQSSYVAGRTDFVDVIDTWRRWLQVTLGRFRALGRLEQAIAELEFAVGASMPELEDLR